MFITVLFLSAISIAAVAAYFSITGLVAVFSASALAIIIMGSVLEAGKLVLISYAYRYWSIIGFLQRSMSLFFITVLMAVTSIGIFGFLSKAHLEKVGPQEQYVLQIERLQEKVDMEQTKIDRNQKVLDNLDQALDKYIELGFVTRGLEQREEQADQRATVETAIAQSESKIDEYNSSMSEIRSKIQEIELEVGPIKYIAEMIYGDTSGAIDKAIKILIVLLVCTFDPLAVMLLIGANHAFMHRNDKRVRSEFSMFEKKDTVQDEKLLYDDLSEEEKEIHRQKVREYVESMNDKDDDDINEDTQKKYEGMVDKNKVSDIPEVLNDEDSESSEESENSRVESPYKLHNLDNPKRGVSSWLPKFKK